MMFIRVTICFVEKFMPSMLQRFQKNQKQDNVHIQLGKNVKVKILKHFKTTNECLSFISNKIKFNYL